MGGYFFKLQISTKNLGSGGGQKDIAKLFHRAKGDWVLLACNIDCRRWLARRRGISIARFRQVEGTVVERSYPHNWTQFSPLPQQLDHALEGVRFLYGEGLFTVGRDRNLLLFGEVHVRSLQFHSLPSVRCTNTFAR